jgi:pyruvate dehydrogenase E2 component (dihydrolipoamide acetyltransferase)
MALEFELPDVGEGLTEAEIVDWLVEPGDTVSEDQPVAEVETDKAVVEVPAPVDGTVRELRAEIGETVDVGTVLITFDVEGEAADPASDDGDTADKSAGGGSEAADQTDEGDADAGSGTGAAGGRTFASPSVRQLARELDVDLEVVDGSGPGGRITRGDVQTAASERDEQTTAAETADKAGVETVSEATKTSGAGPSTVATPANRDQTAAIPATRGIARDLDVDIDSVPTERKREGHPYVTAQQVRDFAAADKAKTRSVDQPNEQVERVPYRGLRRTIGEQMERSASTIPHVSAHHHPDVTELVEAHSRLAPEAEERGVELTYMPFIMKATVAALKAVPMFNAELDEENEEIIKKSYYHINIATATEDGLLVPVVENVDQKGILELAEELNVLAERARNRDLSPSELRGGTFTISNYGAIGGNWATPMINLPEVGILGIGELKQRPRVVNGEVVPRHTMPMSVSFDHRLIDGLDGGRFANHVIDRLEDPLQLLL